MFLFPLFTNVPVPGSLCSYSHYIFSLLDVTGAGVITFQVRHNYDAVFIFVPDIIFFTGVCGDSILVAEGI